MNKKAERSKHIKRATLNKSATGKINKSEQKVIEKKWFWIGGAATFVVLAAITVGLIMYYVEPTVARVNRLSLNVSDVSREMRQAEDMMTWEYFGMFPEDEVIDYDRVFRGDMTFGRAVREEAARMAAFNGLYRDYARRLGIPLMGDESLQHLISVVTQEIVSNSDEFARFEQYMAADESADAEDRANAILARALGGEDFDVLIATYGEDPGMEGNPDGYTFTAGMMVPEFEQGTRELEIGEISGLVRSQFGYHIIKRVEPNPDNVMGGAAEGEELLGAKHILIATDGLSLEDRMWDAVSIGFEAMVDRDLVLLSALDRVPIDEQ